ADLVPFRHHPALLVGMQERGDRRYIERGRHAVALEQLEDARHADPVAELPPAHPAKRLAAIAQLVGLMIAVEGKRQRAARATLPALRAQRAPGAHVVDDTAPMLLRPLP